MVLEDILLSCVFVCVQYHFAPYVAKHTHLAILEADNAGILVALFLLLLLWMNTLKLHLITSPQCS